VKPYLQNSQSKKRAGGMAQVVDHLPSKHEVLIQALVPKQKKKLKIKNNCSQCLNVLPVPQINFEIIMSKGIIFGVEGFVETITL
jgi:hypothetical protein